MGTLYQGDVLATLAGLDAESVSCCVTSPPYWSLRKYDAEDVTWGGEAGCEHEWAQQHHDPHPGQVADSMHPPSKEQMAQGRVHETATCARCGAWRGQFGLEPTPELYVEHTLTVLRAIRRVLRPDGVVWWNIGDGYSGSWGNFGARDGQQRTLRKERYPRDAWEDNKGRPPSADGHATLKPKDLVLMPQRVALAAQADGWWVRSMIVWAKPNAMPESVKDRPTDAHEYVIMLTRSARYFYDQEAVREGLAESTLNDGTKTFVNHTTGRNLRSVWTFPTAQTPEAHFATFPTELPRRCIEASCPKEICSACGKARVRVVERKGLAEHPAPCCGRFGSPVQSATRRSAWADYDGSDGYGR
jgi:DNA modification methylase